MLQFIRNINPDNSIDNLIQLCIAQESTIISLLLLFTLSCVLLLFIPTTNYNLFRSLSLLVCYIPLFWCIYLWVLYDGTGHSFQCTSYVSNLHLSFGIDAVGLALVLLTSAIFPICIFLMRTPTGIMSFLFLELVIIGSLFVLDLLGFYILFEASLIILYLIIARPEKLSGIQYSKHLVGDYTTLDAAYRIVLYTMVGSLLFLPVILILYNLYGSTNLFILTCSSNPLLNTQTQLILGWGLLAVFAVKIPLMPIHLWLPEAHVAAPTAGSVLLAGVLLKLGGLGIIRFLIPIFPVFVAQVFPILALLCLATFLFSTLTVLRQTDLKKIVAYSSIAHMALVTLTIFSMSEHSVASSTFMMVAHGLVSPGLFLLVGFVYERSHTKYLPLISGLGSHMPIYAILFFILTLANLSFPLSPNFIAEVLCLVSLFAVHPLYAYVFCISQVLGAVYGFWTMNRLIHGYNSNTFTIQTNVVDLSRKEFFIILPLLIGIFWLGFKPFASY